MKKFSIAVLSYMILLAPSFAGELIKDLRAGGAIVFSEKVNINSGQRSLRVGSGACLLRFPKASSGDRFISEGTHLTVSDIRYDGHWESIDPSTGAPILVLPKLEVRFKGLKTKLSCRGHRAIELTSSDLESDNILRVIPSKAPTKAYTIE